MHKVFIAPPAERYFKKKKDKNLKMKFKANDYLMYK